MEQLISIGTDKVQGDAYLALPDLAQAPGVLLFHAWWGLNTFFRDTCSRLSKEGFAVLAPDYFQGGVASTIEEAKSLRSQMDRSYAYGLAKQSLDHLLALDSVYPKQVAVIGFSLGCGAALELARSRPEVVRAVVLFYGAGGGRFDAARADFLGHFAEDDQWGAHAKKVTALKQRLLKSGGEVDFYTYPNTQHWFFESDRPEAYIKIAAEEAWTRTLDFLRAKLV